MNIFLKFEEIYKKFNTQKFTEVKSELAMKKLSEFILLLLKGDININEFNKKVLNTVGRSANSIQGIVSNDTGVASLNTRIDSAESIYNLIIYSCNFLQDGSDTPKRAKALLIKYKDIIIERLNDFIKFGNNNTKQNEFSYEKYIKKVGNFL